MDQNGNTEAYFIPPPSYDICIQQTPNDMITNTEREADTDTKDVPWSSSLYKASLCSMLCCSLFGVIATTMSVMAYVDHMFLDIRGVRRKQDTAKKFIILAVTFGIIFITFFVLTKFTYLVQLINMKAKSMDNQSRAVSDYNY